MKNLTMKAAVVGLLGAIAKGATVEPPAIKVLGGLQGFISDNLEGRLGTEQSPAHVTAGGADGDEAPIEALAAEEVLAALARAACSGGRCTALEMAAGVKTLFGRFDRDGSGGLDITELMAGLRVLEFGLGRDQLKALRSELAGGRAAVISFEAFTASLEKHARAATERDRAAAERARAAAERAQAEAVAAAERARAEATTVWAHPRITDIENIFLDNEDGGGDGSMAASELCARLQQGEPPLPEAQAAALCNFLVESGLGRVALVQFQAEASKELAAVRRFRETVFVALGLALLLLLLFAAACQAQQQAEGARQAQQPKLKHSFGHEYCGKWFGVECSGSSDVANSICDGGSS